MTEDVALTVAAVARRLGVAPATLRTWDRRYGLGPSEHSAGAHRRYSPGDVDRLMTMRRLTLEGVAPSEAARSAMRTPRAGGPSEAEVLEAYAEAEMPADPAGLLAAARHADSAAVRWMLARVHPRDVLEWYATLVRPALAVLARDPVVERPGDSACHRLEASAFAELRSRHAALAARLDGGPATDRPLALVIPLGAVDLDAHVLAAALTGRGVAAGVLAGGTPAALAAAVEGAAPRAVVLLAAHEDHAADLARALAARVLVFWHREGLDPVPGGLDVHRVRSLAGACHEVVAVLG